jgi:uncharacterized protein
MFSLTHYRTVILALGLGMALQSCADGFMVGKTAYDSGDYASALQAWEPLAQKGDPRAQISLGRMYRKGEGVPQDYGAAVIWYHRAAEQGYATGQFLLGEMYLVGLGVPQDYVLAHMWYNLAAAQGDEEARARRKETSALMSPALVVEAQKLARDWRPKKQ